MNAQMLKSDSRYIQHECLESESLAPSVGLLGAKGADILGFNLANGRAGNESFVVWSLIMLGAHGFVCTRIIIPMTNPASCLSRVCVKPWTAQDSGFPLLPWPTRRRFCKVTSYYLQLATPMVYFVISWIRR